MDDIQHAETTLQEDFGFLPQEIKFVMRHKPSFIALDDQDGLTDLRKFFVDKYGFTIEQLRTLVVKYPYIVGKSHTHLEDFFARFRDLGLSNVTLSSFTV